MSRQTKIALTAILGLLLLIGGCGRTGCVSFGRKMIFSATRRSSSAIANRVIGVVEHWCSLLFL